MQGCQCGRENGDNREDFCSIYCKLRKFDWYWSNISRSNVEYLLLKYPGQFIIRASSDASHILCISFRVDPESYLKGRNFSHMTLKHYNGQFSMDRQHYVPVEDIPQHCEKVGREMNIFKAKVLKKNTELVIEMSKIFCKQQN